MMETGVNETITITSGEKMTKKETVEIIFGVFFDGTGNNKWQAMAGMDYRSKVSKKKEEKGAPLTKDELNDLKKGGFKVEVNDKLYTIPYDEEKIKSQENDETNVDLLEQMHKKKGDSTADQIYASLYIEGAGTYNIKDKTDEESNRGGAAGKDPTGVLEKVDYAIDQIPELIEEIKKKQAQSKQITKLEFNVFGFSRGAAEARNFVGRFIESQSKREMRKKRAKFIKFMEGKVDLYPSLSFSSGGTELILKYELGVGEIKVNFVGLYDTVSSFGFWGMAGSALFGHDQDNVEDLYLNTMQDAASVLHICAADEFRQNFALTTIDSCMKCEEEKRNGIEITIPGAHSDIGGSYAKGRHTKTVRHCTKPRYQPYYINYKEENGKLIELDRNRTKRVDRNTKFVELSINSLKKLGWIPENAEFKQKLGWKFSESECKEDSYYQDLLLSDQIRFSNYVKKGYGLVGLDLMIYGAKKNHADVFKLTIRDKKTFPTDLPVIQKIKDMGIACIDSGKFESTDIYKKIEQDYYEDYRKLRAEYLHFSSDNESLYFVNDPRYDDQRVLRRAIIKG